VIRVSANEGGGLMDDDVALILAIENLFGISLPDDRLANADTFGDLCEIVVSAMNASGPAARFTFNQIWPAIQEVTADVLGGFEDELTPDMRFYDLNM
jgi:hypothetical protein